MQRIKDGDKIAANKKGQRFIALSASFPVISLPFTVLSLPFVQRCSSSRPTS